MGLPMSAVRVTEALDYFKQPWYVDWVLRTFAKQFKKHPDVEKAQKFAMRDLRRICDEATDIGSRVDELIKEAFSPMSQTATPMPTATKKDSPEVHMAITAFCKWYEVYQPKRITPLTRLSKNFYGLDLTGEPDLDVDGVTVDIKCAKRMSLGYWVQVNVYRFLQGGGGKVGILRLDKETGSYEYVVKDYDAGLVDVWVGLARAMEYFKGEQGDGGLDVQEE